jgi:CheY-like chemotaxis protein
MHQPRILCVDDDFISNMETCEFLRGSGFAVSEVYCAYAAFEAIDRHGYLSGLVTDIDLGAGASGFEVARRARAVHPSLPVVFISGMAAARYRAEGVENAVFIEKPFQPLQILQALKRAIPLEAA